MPSVRKQEKNENVAENKTVKYLQNTSWENGSSKGRLILGEKINNAEFYLLGVWHDMAFKLK